MNLCILKEEDLGEIFILLIALGAPCKSLLLRVNDKNLYFSGLKGITD